MSCCKQIITNPPQIPGIYKTYPNYHEYNCEDSISIPPHHIHHIHHCCENEQPKSEPKCVSKKFRVPVLESFPWQETVKSKISTDLPENPSKGDRYLVYIEPKLDNDLTITQPEINTTLLKDYKDCIVWFDGYNWNYDIPQYGWTVYVEKDAEKMCYFPNGWKSESPETPIIDKSAMYYDSKIETMMVNCDVSVD